MAEEQGLPLGGAPNLTLGGTPARTPYIGTPPAASPGPVPTPPLELSLGGQPQRVASRPAPGASDMLSAAHELRNTLKLVQDLRQSVDSLRDAVRSQAERLQVLEGKSSAAPTALAVRSPHVDVEMELDLVPVKPEGLTFTLDALLRVVIKHRASDLHLKAGAPPTVRLNGELVPIGDQVLSPEDCRYLVLSAIPEVKRGRLQHLREVDHAYVSSGVRFRMNGFLERGRLSAAFRMVNSAIPGFESLGLPHSMTRLSSLHHGLVLVTGPAGSGKSTTLAAMVDWINRNRKAHIVTIEDPIEYYHLDDASFITQREVGTDTLNFAEALRQCLRQDPNVILVGEMRDTETILTAVTAAETGHLVLSTLHTPNSVQAIDRIVDTFAGDQQKQIRMLLSSCLKGVVSQKLLTRADGQGRIPAIEVLVCTSTVSSLILEGNTKEIYQYITQGANEGMQTFTQSLTRLVELGLVTAEEAMFHADQATELSLATRNAAPGHRPAPAAAPRQGAPPPVADVPSSATPDAGPGSYLNWL